MTTMQEFIEKTKNKYNFANQFQKIVLDRLDIDTFLMLEQVSSIAMGMEGEIASAESSDENDRIALVKELADLVNVEFDDTADETTLLKFAILATLELITTTKMDEERKKKMEDLVPKLAQTFGDTYTYALKLAIDNLEEEGSDEG